jgi:hypothetical protein
LWFCSLAPSSPRSLIFRRDLGRSLTSVGGRQRHSHRA